MGMGDILTIIKLSMLRFFTKRPYGLAYFKINKNLFSKIIRFDKETIRTSNGIWTFDKDLIYVEKDAVKENKKEVLSETPTDAEVVEAVKTGKVKELMKSAKSTYKQAEFLGWKSGIPIVFLDQNNMQPVAFQGDAANPTNPRNIQSILNKEISAFEAELMRKQRDKLEKLLIITLLFSGITLLLVYLSMNDIGALKEAVAKIPLTSKGLG